MRIIVIAIASLALLLFAASEVLVEMPVALWLYVLVAAIFAAGLLQYRPPRQQLGRLIMLSATFLVMAVLYLAPWSSRSAFLRRFYSIRPGMTVNEARAVMVGYIEGTGWPANPFVASRETTGEFAIQGALVFRHSNDPAYNSDWGIVHFRDGRVTSVEFSPD
jgi:hypothetical protein